MGFSVNVGQVSELLAGMHSIALAHRGALRSRLQHFARLGFPAGIKSGRGRAAEYGIRQIVELVLAFELLQARMQPEEIVLLFDQLQDRVPSAFDRASFSLNKDRERHYDVTMAITSQALAYLSDAAGGKATPLSLEFVTLDEVPSLVEDVVNHRRRISLVNAQAALEQCACLLEDFGIFKREEFESALKDWAEKADIYDYYPDLPRPKADS